ncbi:MAG: glutaredoxin family protein [Candidatus Dormibacteraceae bacterium]
MRIYTTAWCGDCKMAKRVLEGAGVDYEEIDLDRDPAAVATVLAINGGYRTVPTILFLDGRVLVEPSRRELLAALGLAQDPTFLDRVSKLLHPHG